MTWASRLERPYLIYYKDRPDQEPFTAANKAKSETNLLKFIVDFYDMLPQNVIIVHQYEYKNTQHEGSLVDLLNNRDFPLRYSQSLTPGFWNFNTYTISSIRNELSRIKASGWWEACMEPTFGPIDPWGDFGAGKKGAAQFVVSRDRIRGHPRSFYQNMYNWLVTHTLDEEPTEFDPVTKGRILTPQFQHPHSNFFTSRYMEWSWELIFTTYHSSHLITQRVGNFEVEALYGSRISRRDVTSAVIQNYFKSDGTIKISPDAFNSIFGDPAHGVPKQLELKINGTQIKISEDREIELNL